MTEDTSNNSELIDNQEESFEALLHYLQHSRGFDFTAYKRASLKRRVAKRMQSIGIDAYDTYQDYLEVHPTEFPALFNTILVNITSFFRDEDAWNYLWHEIFPQILSQKEDDAPIRVWSAGCASGEEAYTLAMILAELLGEAAFCQRVKIYATDVDEEALATARQGTYSRKAVDAIPEHLRDKYFEVVEDRYLFHSELRRNVIFGCHNLLVDAPISRLDVLSCRNTLMYFNVDGQRQVLTRFHFALQPQGVLFLGKAEMLLTHANLFTPVNLQNRIFTPVSNLSVRDRRLMLAQVTAPLVPPYFEVAPNLRAAAFDAGMIAQVIIDMDNVLVMANQAARMMFNLSVTDLGQPLQDLELSYRPLELRSRLEQVRRERETAIVYDVVRHLSDGKTQYLDVRLSALTDINAPQELLGVSVTFTDVTRYHHLNAQLQQSNQELETANEELQSSNEELETTNEELQSSNEELETTNEELRSSNEELETVNEELHAANEELQVTNEELGRSSDRLRLTNSFLESVLESIRAGVVVINRQFNILTWNRQAQDLWGLSANEVEGQSFFSLDIGLPVHLIRDSIRQCLNGEDQGKLMVDAQNRRGRTFPCEVTCSPLLSPEGDRLGVIIFMSESTFNLPADPDE